MSAFNKENSRKNKKLDFFFDLDVLFTMEPICFHVEPAVKDAIVVHFVAVWLRLHMWRYHVKANVRDNQLVISVPKQNNFHMALISQQVSVGAGVFNV